MADKKYWCKLCTGYHKDRDTYLQHKKRFEKRKEKRKKEPESAVTKPTKKVIVTESDLTEQIVTTPTGNKVLVSDSPRAISLYLKAWGSAKAITSKDVAKQVSNIMGKASSLSIKEIPTITTKPGKGTLFVEELTSSKYGEKAYTCEECEYYIKVRGQDACIRWKKPGFDFSKMTDIEPCTQFRTSEWI